MAILDRGGVRIHWRCEPPAETAAAQQHGVPVLLSHGFSETADMWAPNLPALAANRRVLTWDLRGHGRSAGADDQALYTQDQCIADMAAILDAAGAAKAVVGGLSLGGYLSLAFWLAHPQRVAALMLFDTGPGFRKDEARQQWNDRALATAGRLERQGLNPAGPPHASARLLALAARGMLTQHDARVMECLPAIDVPVLVLAGARDRAFLGSADYMAAKIPGARRVVIPDAGHVSNIDQPAAFNREVLDFLEGLTEGAS